MALFLKMYIELQFLISADRLIITYICTKFSKKYLERFQSNGVDILLLIITKGRSLVKLVRGVTVLVFCIPSNLHLYQVSRKYLEILNGFRVMEQTRFCDRRTEENNNSPPPSFKGSFK